MKTRTKRCSRASVTLIPLNTKPEGYLHNLASENGSITPCNANCISINHIP